MERVLFWTAKKNNLTKSKLETLTKTDYLNLCLIDHYLRYFWFYASTATFNTILNISITSTFK